MANKIYECPDCGERFENDFDEDEQLECSNCNSFLELDQDGDLISINAEEDEDTYDNDEE